MTKRIRVSVAALVVGFVLAISCSVWAGARIRTETKTVYYRADLKIVVDGRQTTLDVEPFIIDPGWIMVPAEFISKELGAAVAWDDASSTFTITTKGTTAQTPQAQGQGTPSSPVQKDIKGLVAQVSSSVVLITTYDSSGQGRSQGSGVVVGKDMVITNLHVITGASRVSVFDAAGGQHDCPGTLGVDTANDLALLKCETGLSPVRLGDPGKVVIGDQVVAIGNPRGLQGTVSDGIVSGIRNLDGRSYIQTTAPISPGSSGGGLFAMDGALVGITTAMVMDAQNLNLAVPANLVKILISRPGVLTSFAGDSPQPKQTLTPQVTYTLPNGDRYVGQVKDGKYNGQGTYTWANGDKYEGEWKDGKMHGLGMFTSANGIKYVGEFRDDKFNGQGTFTWATGLWAGDKYVGEFRDGKFNGQGTYTWANGNKYVGEFEDDKKHGQGTFTPANGDKYVGEFRDDKQHGQGTFTSAEGNKYVGEFRDDKFNGQGSYTWANGIKYVGEFRDDKQHGQGTMTWPSGDKYVGEWKDGKYNGQGTFTWVNGNIQSGLWINGVLTSPGGP
jgi:hypothetical protein